MKFSLIITFYLTIKLSQKFREFNFYTCYYQTNLLANSIDKQNFVLRLLTKNKKMGN